MPRTRKPAEENQPAAEPLDIAETGAIVDQPAATGATVPLNAADVPSDTPNDIDFDAEAAEARAAGTAIDFDALAAKIKAREDFDADADALDTVAIDQRGTMADNAATIADATGSAFFLDLSKADEKIANIAIGTRAVVAVTAAEAKISAKGNPFVSLRVKTERIVSVPRGVNDETAATYRNRTIRENVTFTPPNTVTGSRGTLWRAKLTFDAFGVPWAARGFRSQGEFMEWLHSAAEMFVGAIAEAEIGEEVNDGQIDPATNLPYPPRNTIARFFKYTPPAPIVNDSDEGDDDEPPF